VTASMNRRVFLAATGGAALVLAVVPEASAEAPAAGAAPPGAATTDGFAPNAFAPNAFVRVERDGRVEVTVPRTEIGQGVRTSLAMLVAEELAVPFAAVRVRTAEADPRYGGQMTAGSTSIRILFTPLRRAGATGRALLVRAAAVRWGVPDAECRAVEGRVVHPRFGMLPYGLLLAEAAALDPATVPVTLLPRSEWRIIGRTRRRVDNVDVLTGRARYGLDVVRPDGLVAVLARPPLIGATPGQVDDSAALAVPGVVAVHRLPTGVAVLAENTAAALRGRERLAVTWTGGDPSASSADWLDELARAVPEPPQAPPGTPFSASFRMPMLAHACMEPINATAHVTGDAVAVWVPTQVPEVVQQQAAELTGVDPTRVRVEIPLGGGGFGRRAETDVTEEAIRLSALVHRPVKVMWTRDDDTRHGSMRPASAHTLHAVLDDDGTPVWRHHAFATWPLTVAPFFDRPELIVQSGDRFRYDVPGTVVAEVLPAPLRTGFWRSVYAGQLVVAEEMFLTAIALHGGLDQVALRRDLLAGQPRLLACLEAAASAFGWGRALSAGHGAGVACLDEYGSAVAVVAEVDCSGAQPRAVRVVVAVDVGVAVNPGGLEAQVHGGVADAVSTVLGARITVRDGAVVQSSFRDYAWLRIDRAPRVEVVLVPSTAEPGGAGELSYPPAAAALAGAVHAATGRRPAGLPVVGEIG
jgi:isoquinoline 1-oxidoreductase subunit beta